MINRDLTPDEVESLLCATSDERNQPAEAAQPTVVIRPSPAPEATQAESACRLDAALRQRVTETLSTVGKRWCQSLTTPLRTEVSTGALEVRFLERQEFTRQFETPACIEVMAAEDRGSYLYLQVDRSLVFVMIDRLLGGGRQPSPVVRRPLTEIEMSLFLRLTESWRQEMSRQLFQNQSVALRSLRVEADSERLPDAADGPLVFAEMSLRVAQQTGRCRVGLPLSIASQLQPPEHNDAALAENLPPTGIAVIAGNVRLRADEMHQLKAGQTLFTDDLPRVYVDRKLMYAARLGAQGEQKAVQIDQVTSIDSSD